MSHLPSIAVYQPPVHVRVQVCMNFLLFFNKQRTIATLNRNVILPFISTFVVPQKKPAGNPANPQFKK